MGKVQYIKKARKQWKCNKCLSIIEVGESYYKGEINFGPTIVRCTKCRLQHWEVTTSEYSLRVGEFVNTWADEADLHDGLPEELASELEGIRDEVQERLDNMPEQLQYSPTGELLQERIDALESAQSDLECIDVDDIKRSAVEDVMSDLIAEYVDAHPEVDEDDASTHFEDMDYDELMESDEVSDDIKDKMREAFEDGLTEAINDILEQLEY